MDNFDSNAGDDKPSRLDRDRMYQFRPSLLVSKRYPRRSSANPPADESLGPSITKDGSDFSNVEEWIDTTNSHVVRGGKLTCTSFYVPILILLSIIVFAAIVIYTSIPTVKLSASNSILVLRILSEANTILLAVLASTALEYIQWTLTSRKFGSSLLAFLSLDSGTGVMKLFQLLMMRSWRHVDHKFWSAAR
jgi:hypothetical protein